MKTLSKITMLMLVVLLFVSQAFSTTKVDDQNDLASLADGFALAMTKKDKAWMEANLTNECLTYLPTGDAIKKQSTIQAFTGAVYDIQKSTVANKSFLVSEMDAVGTAEYSVEGSTSDGGDISGTYKLSLKFKKTDLGWRISEILIHGGY